MIKVDIEYTCDKCGKVKKEKTIVRKKGYEDIPYLIESKDSAFLPSGWSGDEDEMLCKKCTKDWWKEQGFTDSVVMA